MSASAMLEAEVRPVNGLESHSKLVPLDGFLRINQILEIFPIGRSTWWLGVREGRFPAPKKLGPATTAWKVSDIRKLIEEIDQQQE